jgi:DNA polymerase-3 subunit epsilon
LFKYNVDFVKTGSEIIALLLENEEIKKHKPVFNTRRKADAFTHCLDSFVDDKGIINFKLVEFNNSENALTSFNSYSSARERLETLIDEHTLCLRYCGLTDETSVCFNHQLRKCNGICDDKEEVVEYNRRAQRVLEMYSFQTPNFAIIDRGRTTEERSVILIENGHYTAYGYIDESTSFHSQEELKNNLTVTNYFPDADDLVKSWIRKNKPKILAFEKVEQKTI